MDTDHLVGVGRMHDNLYLMDIIIENHYISFFNPRDMSLNDWHIFKGHPSVSVMQHMNFPKGRQYDEAVKIIENYEVCIKAKQSRDSFPVLNKRTTELFEMVHGDIWGPYTQENICHTSYVLNMVEDFSRTIWTFLLQSKDQVHEILANYIQFIQTQFDKRIKAFRTDHGTEFLNRNVAHLFSQNGISNQKSCVYTPQRNGIVERRHRHLLATARALMFQSGLPIRFWPYSLLTATWIINILPSRILEWKSPHELLFGNALDYSMIRPFGCFAYAANLVPNRGKFYSRSIKCVFLGYDVSHKGFLLLDLSNEKILISRDVKFVTDNFPFHTDVIIPAEPHISFPTVTDNPQITLNWTFLPWISLIGLQTSRT